MKNYFKIVKDTNPTLRVRCEEIKEVTPEVISFVNDLHDYLVASQDEKIATKYNLKEGVGLAAPQVGRNIKALAVYFVEENEEGSREVDHRLINPKIILESIQEAYLSGGEGCLSVDNPHEGYVYRHNKIQVRAINAKTLKEEIITARGYEAIVLQHEIDHLNGILYYDHINKKNPFEVKENAIREFLK